MASASPQFIGVAHPLEGLFERLGVSGAAERVLFDSSWRQLCRHAPLFGYADHPDVDGEHLEQVQHAVHEQLAAWARNGEVRAVEHAAVRAMLAALRSSRGLVAAEPPPELAALLEPASARLCEAAGCRYVPLAELFHYNRSLGRHYGVHGESFAELIDWCVAAIEVADEGGGRVVREPPAAGLTVLVRRFVADMRRLAPSDRPRAVPQPPLPTVEPDALPPVIARSPAALVELAAASAPEHGAEPGAGHSLVQSWYALLDAELGEGFASVDDVDTPKRLPPLVESALLVHLLGLEDRGRKAVVSAAADRLLVQRLIPAARAVGARNNRHEPVAVLLVGVVAAALRPWSFAAPSLTTDQRIVLLALLAELATGKARKVLHEEKQHAGSHAHPEAIRAAVNRALARWPGCVHEVSPKQRIDRVAAGLRYLSRVRRGAEPRVRDLAIVAELLGR